MFRATGEAIHLTVTAFVFKLDVLAFRTVGQTKQDI